MSTLRLCPNCSGSVPDGCFTCPVCDAPQPAGPPLRSKLPTRLAPSHALALPARQEIFVAAVTFCDVATLDLPLTPVGEVVGVNLELGPSTNGEAALLAADQVLFAHPNRVYTKNVVVLESDGSFNASSGNDPKADALVVAQSLKAKGVRLGTVLFDAGDHDEDALRSIASSHSLFMRAGKGQLMSAMLSVTRLASRAAPALQNRVPGTAIVFCLDRSGSMGEGNKKEEAEAAFMRSVEELQKM